jgi:PAS domain S-box-containing protein
MLRANAAWQAAYGKTAKDYEGKTETELWAPHVARRLHEQDRRCREMMQPLETVERLPNAAGETRVWLVSKFPIQQDDGRVFIGGTSLDITDREAATEELESSNHRYRTLFNASESTSRRGSSIMIRSGFSRVNQGSCGNTTAGQKIENSSAGIIFRRHRRPQRR